MVWTCYVVICCKMMNINEWPPVKMATQSGDGFEARANEHEREDDKMESEEYYTDQTVRCAYYFTQNDLKSPLVKFVSLSMPDVRSYAYVVC